MDKQRKLFSHFSHRIIVATGILIFTLIYFVDVSSLNNPQDRLMVSPVIWIIIILYPIIIWQEWKENKKRKNDEQLQEQSEDDETSAKLNKRILLFMVSTLVYLAVMSYLGFIISTIIYMPFLMWVLGTKSKKVLVVLPIAFTILLFFLFNNLLGIPLPQGFLQGVL